ncbi:MAG: phage major capsid protein, partial [Acidobacteriota bacterium]
WYLDVGVRNGSGAVRPLGVLNSPSLVVTPKSVGQAKDTVVYENLTNMLGRLAPASFGRSVWVCHQTLIPQLLSLSVVIGTSGAYIPALSQVGGQFTLLTRPVVFTEKLEPLGSQGDILLADFSAYAIGMRSSLRLERSIGPLFQQDKISWRAITRVDGQSLWDKALTLADGVTKVSPFVTLAVRS